MTSGCGDLESSFRYDLPAHLGEIQLPASKGKAARRSWFCAFQPLTKERDRLGKRSDPEYVRSGNGGRFGRGFGGDQTGELPVWR